MNSITRQSMPTAAIRGTSVGVSATSTLGNPSAQQQAESAGGERHEHALREDQTDDPRPGRPERGAERDLTAAPRRAGEEQVGDVRTGDQQHQR